MSDITTTAIARQSGLLKELNVLANNIANASTAGYRREASVFTEYVQRRGDQPSLSIGAVRGHYTVLSDGAVRETGGTFDLALNGEGFFAIQRGEEVLLTRAGQFSLDADRRLVTPEGDAVLDEGGGAIEIPPEARDITIARDGTIGIDGAAFGRLGVFATASDNLERVGGNLYRPTEAYTFVDTPTVMQGFVEGSNVDPVIEMARLIEAQRAFEAGQKILDEDHQRQKQMIDRMARA